MFNSSIWLEKTSNARKALQVTKGDVFSSIDAAFMLLKEKNA